MMNNRINEVSRQYTYAVEPVKMFETKNNPQAQKSSFDFFNQMNLNKNSFNPFHPNIQTETTAKRLDFTC